MEMKDLINAITQIGFLAAAGAVLLKSYMMLLSEIGQKLDRVAAAMSYLAAVVARTHGIAPEELEQIRTMVGNGRDH